MTGFLRGCQLGLFAGLLFICPDGKAQRVSHHDHEYKKVSPGHESILSSAISSSEDGTISLRMREEVLKK